MVLIIEKEMDTGLVLENAYCKVEEITANKEKMNFYLGIYLNKEARKMEKTPLETKPYSCEHDVTINEKFDKASL